jgi:hypothetical protein
VSRPFLERERLSPALGPCLRGPGGPLPHLGGRGYWCFGTVTDLVAPSLALKPRWGRSCMTDPDSTVLGPGGENWLCGPDILSFGSSDKRWQMFSHMRELNDLPVLQR